MRVLIMAGGTGGHVFPALAVAEDLRVRGHTVTWLGTARGIEARLVPQAGIALETISVTGLRGKGWLAVLAAPWRLARALWQALAVLRYVRPQAVLGMGGFASGPGGLAAWLCRVPLVVHEQNAIPGLTNRLLARLAITVLEAFPGSFPAARAARAVGNPVRPALTAIAAPAQRFAARNGSRRVLVLGGSQGAQALNEIVPRALLETNVSCEVWHQTGAAMERDVAAAYAQHGIQARTAAFIDDMATAYAWADLVICRAGAMTVSEVAAAGVAAVFVPFPAAVDDHQTHNARVLEAAGAARIVQQHDLSPGLLANVLHELLHDRMQLQRMAEQARTRAQPQATRLVADVCLAAGGEGCA